MTIEIDDFRPAAAGMTDDTITVLTHRTRRMAKLVRADGETVGYDKGRRFDMISYPVADLNGVHDLLRNNLLHRPNACVVRGEIANAAKAKNVRRLVHRDARTGDEPTLLDAPKLWLAVDVEDIPRPPDVPVTDLVGCYNVALKCLPDTFGSAACIIQASGSHGFKPDIRLRLWFWCSRPMAGDELKRWLRATPADPAVFGAAQPIYTAAPVMDKGAVDPIPQRLVMLPGGVLAVPGAEEIAAPRRQTASLTAINSKLCDRYVRAALESAAHRIANASKRHPTIFGECRSLARLVSAGKLAEHELRAVVHAAAKNAGKDDKDEIDRCIEWGLANPIRNAAEEAPHV